MATTQALTNLRPIMQFHTLSLKSLVGFFIALTMSLSGVSQSICPITSDLDLGYSISIQSVTENDGTFDITLLVESEGCEGCERLNRFAVEALPGTYSNISYELLSDGIPVANIIEGPDLGDDIPFQGFRVLNTNGLNTQEDAAAFTVSYTLSSGLQNQQALLQGNDSETELGASFTVEDFQSVLECLENEIVPYYNPPEDGKSFDLIGAELTFLYETFLSTGNFISDDIFQIIDDRVIVSILTLEGEYENALALLVDPPYELQDFVGNPSNRTINGQVPILNLLALNDLTDVLISVRPVYPALSNAGLIVSQGDTSLRSYIARDVFAVNGSGIKVGVLSDSYNTIIGDPASDDVIKRDLPGVENPDFPTPVDVIQDYPFGSLSDEGRAMLQIIHDVAPGAELAFRTGFLGANDFAAGIIELQEAGCDVIVDDITYISEPFFRDGVVAQAADSVNSLGVSYLSAAGNFGNRAWEGSFSPADAPGEIVGQAHNFANGSGTDVLQNVSLSAGDFTVVFQWDDGTEGNLTNSDFDIYLTDDDGNILFGFNSVNTGGAPIEVLPFTVVSETSETNLMIVRESGTGPVQLKYIVFRGFLTINEYASSNTSTLVGQANSEGAMAVGAVRYDQTPEFGVTPPLVESFSSVGGTPVNGVDRMKPEFCAPNGGNTSVDLGGFDPDDDAFPNFFGTSAAAPHAAGVVALILEARQKYYGDNFTPSQVKSLLQNTAIEMGSNGYDVESGAGYILADSALIDFANPSPFITEIDYDTTLIPGVDEIEIRIIGEYLDEGSQVFFNGEPLEGTTTLEGDTAVITIIPPFDDLFPEIQVFNPPAEGTNGEDGGLSNPLYFTTKQTIFIRIADTTKIYGEVLPDFQADYFYSTLDGGLFPIDSAGLTENELNRVLGIELTTIANPLSNVGFWGIEADPSDPLNPESGVAPSDSIDISLANRFEFVFGNGLMEVFPLDLIITPRDTTFVFNDTIVGITFEYNFNSESNVEIGMADSLAITSALQTNHQNEVSNKRVAVTRGTALVNELGEELLSDSVLTNKSILVSSTARTTRGTALVNGELIDPLALAEASEGGSTTRVSRGTALVNGFTLTRGTALVNELDSSGGVINTTALTNSEVLANSNSLVNSTTISEESNRETIVILVEEDISILSGDSIGDVNIEAISLVTGNEVGTHTIVPGAFLTNNFNVQYGLGEILIVPAPATILFDEASLSQTYTGEPTEVLLNTFPDSIDVDITYNGDSLPPAEVGSYLVEASISDSNYVGFAQTTLNILPDTAEISFAEGTLVRLFTGSPKAIEVETNPVGLDVIISFGEDMSAPSEIGEYPVVVEVDDPNFVGSAQGTLEIISSEGVTIEIDESTLWTVFDGTRKPVDVITNPEGLGVTTTYRGDTLAPIDADSYIVLASVNESDVEIFDTGTLIIDKAQASVSTGVEVIAEGDALPDFEAVFSGFLNEDDETVVDSLAFDLSPVFEDEAGIYEVIPFAVSKNYAFTATPGTLYVNPKGEGTSPVRPKFLCYVINEEGEEFDYTAYFRYVNPNQVPVFVPLGPDNLFFGVESDISEQPEVFLPGNDIIAFPFNFDGTAPGWEITTFQNDALVTRISTAINRQCPATENGNKSIAGLSDLDSESWMTLFPNPSDGVVFVRLNKEDVETATIEVFDGIGRRVYSYSQLGVKGLIEVDLSGLNPGIYLVRADLGNGEFEVKSIVLR